MTADRVSAASCDILLDRMAIGGGAANAIDPLEMCNGHTPQKSVCYGTALGYKGVTSVADVALGCLASALEIRLRRVLSLHLPTRITRTRWPHPQ
jgi:hypothetical protein